jgi:nucleoside-diphosphate-sugar epimerase
MTKHENYLVIGGSGFLGSHIVQALVDRREPSVAVYDLHLPDEKDTIIGATYHAGDILDEDKLLSILKQVSMDALDACSPLFTSWLPRGLVLLYSIPCPQPMA